MRSRAGDGPRDDSDDGLGGGRVGAGLVVRDGGPGCAVCCAAAASTGASVRAASPLDCLVRNSSVDAAMPSAMTPPMSSNAPRPPDLRATGCASARVENSPRRRGRSVSSSPLSPWCQKRGVTGPMLARRLVVACSSALSASACRLLPKKRRGASTAAEAASSAARRRSSRRDRGGGELRARRPSLPMGLAGRGLRQRGSPS